MNGKDILMCASIVAGAMPELLSVPSSKRENLTLLVINTLNILELEVGQRFKEWQYVTEKFAASKEYLLRSIKAKDEQSKIEFVRYAWSELSGVPKGDLVEYEDGQFPNQPPEPTR